MQETFYNCFARYLARGFGRSRESGRIVADKSSPRPDRSSAPCRQLEKRQYCRANEFLVSERTGPGTSRRGCLPSFNVLRVVEDSQRLLGNYVTPSNCFTKQSESARSHGNITHGPTTKEGPLQISFRLFDYLTDATIKSSPIDAKDSPVPFSRGRPTFSPLVRVKYYSYLGIINFPFYHYNLNFLHIKSSHQKFDCEKSA